MWEPEVLVAGKDLHRDKVWGARMVDEASDIAKLVCVNAESVPVPVLKVKEVRVVLPLLRLLLPIT